MSNQARHPRPAGFSIMVQQRENQLNTEDEKEKNNTNDFSGAPRGKPALDPSENHPSKQYVQNRKSQQNKCSPDHEIRMSNPDPNRDSQQPEKPNRRACID